MPKTIDVHAHILAEDTMRMIAKEAPSLGLRLTPIDHDFAVFELMGVAYKPYPRGAWDLEQRFKHMKEAEVDMHVLSNTPQTFLYNADASLNATVAAIQNDQIAKHVKDYPDRFYGLATLPMQAPDKAAGELKRAMTKLSLKGAQDRLQYQPAEPRRARVRAGMGGRERAPRADDGASHASRRDGSPRRSTTSTT